jgi:hypothetical protein
MKGAKNAGVDVRVEIALDGKMSIIPLSGSQDPPKTNEWDSVLDKSRLKFVHRFRDRHGKTRHYFRRPGCKTVALPGLPGSAEFMAAYQAALAGHSAPRIEIGAARTKPGTVAAAVAAYFGSIAFGNLAPCTKRTQRYILERFREGHGEKSFTGLERKHVRRENRDPARGAKFSHDLAGGGWRRNRGRLARR